MIAYIKWRWLRRAALIAAVPMSLIVLIILFVISLAIETLLDWEDAVRDELVPTWLETIDVARITWRL